MKAGNHYVLVCGGRDNDSPETVQAMREVFHFLKLFYGAGLRIMHGDARGVDTIAGQLADEMGVPCKAFPADWGRGRRAGIERNEKMGNLLASWITHGHSVEVIAFRGGRGTDHMVTYADRLGINTTRIDT